jgi:NAD+ diphosphatase
MEPSRPNFLAGPYLERRAEAREDAQWLAAARTDPATRYLVARDTAQLLVPGEPGAEPHAALLEPSAPLVQAAPDDACTLLGWFRGARCVLIELPQAASAPPGLAFEELRPLTAVLPADEASLLACARALCVWHARGRFCGICGAPTRAVRAGHCLRCTREGCRHEYFPRLDPAIIVLVSDGERALLGRQASWPARRYSTLAGFVEPGESLEDAVRREVLEETGVSVSGMRYDSSQPWPFPSSLMLGFHAHAAAGAPVRLDGELEDARWVTRSQLQSGEVLAPPSQAISWRLIQAWLDQGGTC